MMGYSTWTTALHRYVVDLLTTATLLAFDDDGNRNLDTRGGSLNNEFVALVQELTIFTQSFESLSKPDDKNIQKAKVSTDPKGDSRKKTVGDLLNDPTLQSALIFVTDNFSLGSNSDGSINGTELSDLVAQLGLISDYSRSFRNDTESEKMLAQLIPLRPELGNPAVMKRFVALMDGGTTFVNNAGLQNDYLDVGQGLVTATLNITQEERSKLIDTSWAFSYASNPNQVDELRSLAKSVMALHLEDTSSQINKMSMHLIWQQLGQNLLDTQSPTRMANAKELRAKCDFTDGEHSIEDCLRKAAKPSLYSRSDLDQFMSTKFLGTGFTWLSRRLQVVMLGIPDEVLQKSFANLIWYAPEILSELDKQLALPLPASRTALLETVLKFDLKKYPKREFLSQSQMALQMTDVAVIFSELSEVFKKPESTN